MNQRETALRRLSAAQFAAWDLHLYLDTHPWDTQAMEAFRQATFRAKRLRAEFEEAFAPLTAAACNANEWIKTPWPWDEQECAR